MPSAPENEDEAPVTSMYLLVSVALVLLFLLYDFNRRRRRRREGTRGAVFYVLSVYRVGENDAMLRYRWKKENERETVE